MNYKVITVASAGDLPASAKENTLAVVMPIAMHDVILAQANIFDTPQAGDVYIKTGTGTKYSFSATKKPVTMVYPFLASYYTGVEWQNCRLFLRQGGIWNEVVATITAISAGVALVPWTGNISGSFLGGPAYYNSYMTDTVHTDSYASVDALPAMREALSFTEWQSYFTAAL